MADLFDDDDNQNDSNEFAQLFEASLGDVGKKLSVGDKIKGEILSIGKEDVFVSTGTMDDGVAQRTELLNAEGQFTHKVGDVLDLFVTQVRGSQVFLSPKPTAKNMADDLEDAFDMMLPIEGRVTESVNGGFRVSLMGKTAFCPISQMDSRRIEDPAVYIGKKFEFLITQFDKRNIVVSRRKLLDEQKELSQASFADDHKPGDVLQGVVTRIEKFGAFVEVAPGLEGLVHISEVGWARLSDPSEAVRVGQQVQVKMLKTEAVQGRLNISLSIKQAAPAPWENMPDHIREGNVVTGRVTRCMKFGAFVELAPGIEGLVPLSEMSYTKRVVRSDEVIKEGETVSVLIKEIRSDERRLLLSVKDAGQDPWSMASQKFPEGAVVKGRIERREPYGLFVKLDEGVTGLLPKSKAMENPEFPFEKLKNGDEVTVQVAELRVADRRISLAVPSDPDAEIWKGFAANVQGATAMGTLGDQFAALFKKK
jgi:small subunit ribosomal protein S1